jgi:hypothetical protein
MLEAVLKAKLKKALGENAAEIIAAIDSYRMDRRQHAIYQAVMARLEPTKNAYVDDAVEIWFEVENALRARRSANDAGTADAQ